MNSNKQNILITGAAGFLGGRSSKHFAAHDNFNVTATSRRRDREKELRESGASFIAGDLTNAEFCRRITSGQVMVIHCAALSSPWGPYNDFYQANVVATQNLVEASLKNGVRRFIFISTPSIYLTGSDRYKVRESDTLPQPMVNHYATTKWLAEQSVLKVNGAGLETLALRPRGIIGAEDTVIFPRLIRSYNEGRLRIIGNGTNVADLTCVRNVIEAMQCAMNAGTSALGHAYNISDGHAVRLWPAINHILEALGHQPIQKRLAKPVALGYASLIEIVSRLLRPNVEPALTRYGVRVLSQSLTLDISKAQSLLGYLPVQTTYEGINEFIEWYRNTSLK